MAAGWGEGGWWAQVETQKYQARGAKEAFTEAFRERLGPIFHCRPMYIPHPGQ